MFIETFQKALVPAKREPSGGEALLWLKKQFPVEKGAFEEYGGVVVGVRKYPSFGYEIRTERFSMGEWGGKADESFTVRSAYTDKGYHIGSPADAYRLCQVKGIAPELRTPDSNTCSIGYSKSDGKIYGWSHRAIAGFKVGDVVKAGDCCEGYLPVGFTAKTEADARRMAEAFAESVS